MVTLDATFNYEQTQMMIVTVHAHILCKPTLVAALALQVPKCININRLRKNMSLLRWNFKLGVHMKKMVYTPYEILSLCITWVPLNSVIAHLRDSCIYSNTY